MRFLIFLLAVAAAGCVDVKPPVVVHGDAWNSGEPDWWVATSHGCGFCSGEGPEHEAIGYAKSGHILIIQYGRGTDGITVSNDIPPGLRSATKQLLEQHDAYGKQSGGTAVERPLHAFSVTPLRIPLEDVGRVNEVIQAGLDNRGPSTGEVSWTDCGPARIESFDPPDYAKHGCGIEANEGWLSIRDQLLVWQ